MDGTRRFPGSDRKLQANGGRRHATRADRDTTFAGKSGARIRSIAAKGSAFLKAASAVTPQAAEKGLATDGHGYTRIKNKELIRVHPCESVARIRYFRIRQT